MNETESRIALIVGGSRGIGRQAAVELAEAGFDIWLTYRSNNEAAESARAEIEKNGQSCELFAFDVADSDAVKKALQDRAEETPPYAVVVSAGVTRDNLMVWMTEEEWNTVVRTDLDGFYNVISAVLFPMLRERRGRIVAVASVSGQIGQAGQGNYSAAKAGVIGAAKALAREVGERNIYVNVVSPGVINTEMTEDLQEEEIKKLIPLGHFGEVADVASVIRFLCVEKNMYVHGQVIGVNGGLAM
ncbi:MAG: 3-oxoacyl-ACP reductase FabG [Candidatus Brocadiia bacterium]